MQVKASMRPDPFRSLLDGAACRMEILSSVGQQLREYYAEQMTAPVPEHLQNLLQRLAGSEQYSPDTLSLVAPVISDLMP